jgi:pimeloyl-[acyl-carrier protein] synthase
MMLAAAADSDLSLYHLLEPETLANPYPLYHRLRTSDPVHWDPYLHAWVVTSYACAVHVMQHFRAERMPKPEDLAAKDLGDLDPIAQVLVRQMIFMDPPSHTRIRALAAAAFTPARVDALRVHIQEITDGFIDRVASAGRMDVIADLADLLPTTVTAELMGIPVGDRDRLKTLSRNFSEMLGNFQHNPGRSSTMLQTVEELTAYFNERIREQETQPREGVVHTLMTAEIGGDRLTREEVIANCIITLTGGLETTTNLIGNGVLSLLENPREFARLESNPPLLPSAVEEFLRFQSPIQKTARLAPDDVELGGKTIRKSDAVIAVIGAANRDPARFPDPDRFDLGRPDNRHLAFGWGAHFCFGAPLARLEAQIVFRTILRRLRNIALDSSSPRWQSNTTFRGLEALPITFDAAA